MAAIIPGYEYDIFISYRQNDNKRDSWVTDFVAALKDELEATLKNPVSIYFDENPHDGLLESHQVGASLEKKLKCLIFIPIISQTYCDTSSFAWEHEFLPFLEMASFDELGMNITLRNGNVASRVLPVRLHELDPEDQSLLEDKLEGPLRAIDFIYKEPGVNRPLKPEDTKGENLYHNQINKVANALKEIGTSILKQSQDQSTARSKQQDDTNIQTTHQPTGKQNWWHEAKSRNVPRAGVTYIIMAWLIMQMVDIIGRYSVIPQWAMLVVTVILIVGLPIAIFLAWKYEKSPTGFISTQSKAAFENPYTSAQKKPFSGNVFLGALLALIILISLGSNMLASADKQDGEVSIAIIPFRNYTNKTELDNFGFGLADEIRTELSLTKKFKNISSGQSTIRFHDSDEDPVRIGEALNVDYLILGNFQQAGEKIKVSIEMVDATNGKTEIQFPPFLTSFENYAELFNIQTEIAAKVMDEFRFDTEPNKELPTTSIEAFTNYQLALKYNDKGWYIEDDQIKAIEYATKAVELDSSYLGAWVALANAKLKYLWSIRQDYYEGIHPEINLAGIEEDLKYIETSFQNSWEVDYIKGVYYYNGLLDYDQGLKFFLKALAINPEDEEINSSISAIYKRKLDLEKALPYRLKTIELDPLSAQNWFELLYIFSYNGEIENAEKAILRAWEMDGDTEEALDRVYWFYYRHKRLEYLPERIRTNKDYIARYTIDRYIETRNWQALLNNIDSLLIDNPDHRNDLKLQAHWQLDNKDSLQFYKAKTEGNDNFLSIMLSENTDLINELLTSNEVMIIGGDKSELAFQKIGSLFALAISGKYEEATLALEEFNKDIPEWGGYSFLNSDIFDKIKLQHPTFNEAINNLIMPPKLGQKNPLDL
jgi:TolB-like protein